MIAGLVGNGIGLGLIAFALILMRHTLPKGKAAGPGGGGQGGRGAAPSAGGKGIGGWVNKIGSRVAMIVMFAGGTALAVTGIGNWIHGGVVTVFGLLGVTGTVIGAVVFLGLLAEAGFKFWRGPTRLAAWCAAGLMLAATFPLAGQTAAIANSLNNAGTQLVTSISSNLGL
jgi:hypothetical protein